MPTFAFEAINNAGKKTTGSIEAGSAEEAIKKVRAQGLFPSGVKEQKIPGGSTTAAKKVRDPSNKKKGKGINLSFGGVSTKTLTLFTRQLSTLQDAGLPLLRSLQILESQQKPSKLKTVLQGVCEEVESGTSLSEAMAKFPKCFDRLYFAPGKDQVHSVAHANETRQTHRAAVYQRHAKATAKHAKVGVLFHDPHIAPKSQFHTAGDGCAADGCDNRFGQEQARGAHGA